MTRHNIGLVAASLLCFVVPLFLMRLGAAYATASMATGFIIWAWTFDASELPLNPLRFLPVLAQRIVISTSSAIALLYALSVGR